MEDHTYIIRRDECLLRVLRGGVVPPEYKADADLLFRVLLHIRNRPWMSVKEALLEALEVEDP